MKTQVAEKKVVGPRARLGVGVTGLLFIGVFGYMAFALTSTWRQQQHAIRSYLPVVATIERAEVEEHTSGRGVSKKLNFQPKVRYHYEVAGTRYSSSTISYLGNLYPSREEALGAMEGFSQGSTVTAFVDSQQPGRSVLDRRSPPLPPVMTMLPFLAFVGLGVALVILSLRGTPAVAPVVRDEHHERCVNA